MEDKRKKCLEIAERIYDLDLEVYRSVRRDIFFEVSWL